MQQSDRNSVFVTPHHTRRRRWLQLTLGAAAAIASPLHAVALPAIWEQRIFQGFGTTLWLRAAHSDRARLNRALDDAVRRIGQIHSTMNLFDPDSAVSRLNREGLLPDPPPDLVHLLRLAMHLSARSGGAFDVTIQPVWQCWEQARRAAGLPDPANIRRAVGLVGWRGVYVSPKLITFRQAGMGITFNGIAQGYAAECARDILDLAGVRMALLDTGEWGTVGKPDSAPGWNLGIEHPRDADAFLARLATDGRFIATSSDVHYRFTSDGREHHILDPKTGRSPSGTAAVVTVHSSGAVADALTKVLFMLPTEQALTMARRWNADALIVEKSGHWHATAGLHLLPG
ncbi:MAG: FAD:protein FMN transferase [Burkholderiaceae bacterium]